MPVSKAVILWHFFPVAFAVFKKLNLYSTLVAGLVAGIVFSIPVFIFIRNASYRESWLLYLGSFLFLVVMWIHTIRESKQRGENENTVTLVFASHMATLAGILTACLVCFILLVIFVPGYLDGGIPEKVLTDEPANIIHDKTEGLSFEVFMSATIINFSVGSFTAIILPFYTKRNQTRDSKEPRPLLQQGAK